MKTQKHILSFVLAIVIFTACSTSEHTGYNLEKSNKQITLALDDNTKSNPRTFYLYKDKSGTEYLTFQNGFQNEILFYNLNTQELEFNIHPEIEGNNGIGSMLGYCIQNLDSIFTTNNHTEKIALIDTTANIKDQISYAATTDSIPLNCSYSTTHYYRPIEIIDHTLYAISRCNRYHAFNPVSFTIDLETKEIKALPFTYPHFPNSDNTAKAYGIEDIFSRCFNGSQFIYSFHYDEDIYIASIDHTTIERKKVKSQYINQIQIPDDYGNTTLQEACEKPYYGNMLYDPYQKVYYRIAYPQADYEKKLKDKDAIELLNYGRKNFSILILDENFEIVGETLFPDFTYNPGLLFIRNDGLYISSSHPLNSQYDDNSLTFERFSLVKK